MTKPGFSRDQTAHACVGGVRVQDVLDAPSVSTPCYIYDVDGIRATLASAISALRPDDIVAYAVKANSSGTILRTASQVGSGADVVSGGEMELAGACGIPASRTVFSGVAKADWELDNAIAIGIFSIQAESVEELQRIAARARALGKTARVGLRINPGVEIDSHSHIATGHDAAKFGIRSTELGAAWDVIDREEALLAVGVSSHVGSMLKATDKYLDGAAQVCNVARHRRAQGKSLEYVDFGGGWGIDYGAGATPAPAQFAAAAVAFLKQEQLDDHRLVVEPGRSMVAPFGVLAAKVVQKKVGQGARWLMLDAGMNDLIRPALYNAVHRIEAVDSLPGSEVWRVVGPVCESSDDFGQHSFGAEPPATVVIRDAGAYGFTLASEYNGRPLPTEVFLEQGRVSKVSPCVGRAAWIRRRMDA